MNKRTASHRHVLTKYQHGFINLGMLLIGDLCNSDTKVGTNYSKYIFQTPLD